MRIKLSIFISLFILTGCGTLYTPSKSTLSIQKTMSHKNALKIFRAKIKIGKNSNICNIRGGLLLDARAKPVLKDNKIKLTAYELGEFIKRDKDGTEFYKKKYYKTEINLSDIKRIDYYTKNTCSSRTCGSCYGFIDYSGKRKNKNDVALIFWPGTLQRFTIKVPEEEVDKFMAAIRIIFPDVKMLLAKS